MRNRVKLVCQPAGSHADWFVTRAYDCHLKGVSLHNGVGRIGSILHLVGDFVHSYLGHILGVKHREDVSRNVLVVLK